MCPAKLFKTQRTDETALFLSMHGTGEYTFTSGTKYVGECRDGMFHGKGVMHFTNGSKYEATWEKGIAVQVRSLCGFALVKPE